MRRDGTFIGVEVDDSVSGVLCGLCLNASPAGTVKVLKLYDGGALLEPAA